jgi:ABC-2 type transport system permease protein
MKKTWLVARREYLFNLRRPAFLFAVFGTPIITFGLWFLLFALISDTETNLDQIGKAGYVDQSGILANPLPDKDNPDLFVAYPDEAGARAALDDKTIGAYFVLPEDYMKTGNVNLSSYSGIPAALKDAVTSFLLANLSRNVTGDVPVERIQQPVDMTIHINDSGRNLTEANLPALIFLPMIFAFVFFMSSNVTSGFLMNGIVEERSNRIMEILVTSVTPMQMLLGKILGLGALGLTQLVVWGGAGAILIGLGQTLPFLKGVVFPLDMVAVFVVYFILSYFLLASLMAGLGAVAGSEQESRQFSTILSFVFVIPFVMIGTFITEPNAPIAVALTFIPFTAPMTVLLRMGFGSVPFWQIAISLVILFASSVFVVWASARVFRWALLLYGKRITIRELWRVIRSSPEVAVSQARAAEGAES